MCVSARGVCEYVWVRIQRLCHSMQPACGQLQSLRLEAAVLPAGCILVSVTTPITMWLYSRMVTSWEGIQGQEDVVSRPSKHQGSAAL